MWGDDDEGGTVGVSGEDGRARAFSGRHHDRRRRQTAVGGDGEEIVHVAAVVDATDPQRVGQVGDRQGEHHTEADLKDKAEKAAGRA
jgi:hypothetical protein